MIENIELNYNAKHHRHIITQLWHLAGTVRFDFGYGIHGRDLESLLSSAENGEKVTQGLKGNFLSPVLWIRSRFLARDRLANLQTPFVFRGVHLTPRPLFSFSGRVFQYIRKNKLFSFSNGNNIYYTYFFGVYCLRNVWVCILGVGFVHFFFIFIWNLCICICYVLLDILIHWYLDWSKKF